MPGTFGFQKSLEVLSNKVFRFIQQTLPKAKTSSSSPVVRFSPFCRIAPSSSSKKLALAQLYDL
ncbi:hypothetical protein O53_1560 [Microcystis aeruginosa TAIHU98]|uniref:Uncharacterized protein n=1 Tax=Microcystis aeruginosa TAIHU98 TaxID=1134457 RepID=L7EDZ7_MICAE|nr:hypothetical protein O53_1560 [Microcystis aeruginosa TAIHU98]ODV39991.1 hypothetical protein BFG60_0499 [Microcystis aeruginosa NIES-98]